MKVLLFMAIFLGFVSQASASVYFCDNQDISRVEIQADRDDNHAYENKLLLRLVGSCSGVSAFYMEQENPMYSGALSLALAAKMSGKKIWLHVNTNVTLGGAMEIAVIGIEE